MKLKLLPLLAIIIFFSSGILAQNDNSLLNVLLWEDFESGTFPPDNWQAIDNNQNGHNWHSIIIYDWETDEENIVAISLSGESDDEDNFIDLEPDNWLVTPQLNLTGNGFALEYQCRSHFHHTDELYSVLVSTTGTQPEDFVHEVFTENTTYGNVFTTRNISLSQFNQQQIYIAFRHHTAEPLSGIMIDDVKVYELPEYDMAAVNLSGNLQVFGGNTAEFQIEIENRGWQDDTYQLSLQEGSWYNLPVDQISVDAGTSATISLEVNVPVDVMMGDLDHASLLIASQNSASTEFTLGILTTALTAISAPHFEDFDQVQTPDLPLGWAKYINSSDQWATIETSGWGSYSEPNHVVFRNADDVDASLLLITPKIEGDLQDMRITFYAQREQSAMPYLKVGTIADPADASTFGEITEVFLTPGYAQYSVLFDSYEGANEFIAIKHVADGWYSSVKLDDFKLEQVLPYEVIVKNTSGVVQAWAGTTANYTVSIKNNGEEDDTYDLSVSGSNLWEINHPATINVNSGQSRNINLQVSVPADAYFGDELTFEFTATSQGDAATSDAVEITTIALSTVTSFPFVEDFEGIFPPVGWSIVSEYEDAKWNQASDSYQGQFSANVQSAFFYDSQPMRLADEWMISPLLDLDQLDDIRLSFYGKGLEQPDGVNQIIRILALDQIYQNTPDLHQNAILVQEVNLSTSWESFVIELGDLEGEMHIAFNYYIVADDNAQYNSILIDNAMVGSFDTYTLTMLQPDGNGSVHPIAGEYTHLENENLTLKAFPALGWEFSHWEGPVEDEHAAVTSIIIDQDHSVKAVFTQLPSETLPLIEDFSGVDEGGIPQKWTATHENWQVSASDFAGGDSPELQFSDWPVFSGISRFISPPVDASGISDLSLSFDHKVIFGWEPVGNLRVMSSTDGENWSEEWDLDLNTSEVFEGNILLSLDHLIGESPIFLAWEFDGFSMDISGWYIDNIELQGTSIPLFTLEFIVEDQQGNLLGEAVITLNDTAYDPGVYFFDNLQEGTYTYSVEKQGYFPVSGQQLELTSDLTEIVVLTTDNTGLSNPDNGGLSVFPNPAANNVSVIAGEDITRLKLINLSGVIVSESTPMGNHATLNVKDLPAGIYLLQIQTGGDITTRRLIISR